MKKTIKMTRILAVVFCLVLIAASAITLTSCKNNETDISDGSPEGTVAELGTGSTEISVIVVDKKKNETKFKVKTDETTVGEALKKVGLIEGEDGAYGLMITKVNGIVADYKIDQTYWAFYINGAYAMSGVDTTDVVAGAEYSFKVEK